MKEPVYRRTYRAGVIGHTGRGNYGHGVGTAFAALPGVEVVAVADPDEAGRAKVIQQNGALRGYANYREMLEREQLDLVAVGPRWLDQHEAMMVAAAEAGAKAIYVEKPLARSLDEADRILAACDARGVKVAVSHQDRVTAPAHLAKDLLAQGKIGRLRVMRAYGKQDRRGGGQDLLVLGTRLLDLMRFYAGNAGQGQAGDVRWCHARVTQDGHDATPADVRPADEEGAWIAGNNILAQYGFDDGVTGTFESVRSDDGGGTDYFRIELCGTAGILTLWSIPGPDVYFYPRPYILPQYPHDWVVLHPEPLPWPALPAGDRPAMLARDRPADRPAGTHQFHRENQWLVKDLLAAVEEDRPSISSGHDGRAALEMIVAVYASHIQDSRVPLPLARRTHPLASWAT